ncbi:MAG TPA: signal peptidase I [Candidatus Dormibacteraeota bacterium]|nr:signal peptidase I [Candidatus Dormibacteraeota bacterium]
MQPGPLDDIDRPPPEPVPLPRRRHHGLVRDVLEVLIIAVVLYIAIWSALQTVRVDGDSMVNTLQNNDLLLASKVSYYFGDPARGDIVVLIPPSDPTKDFIKRVIGLPGDTIEIDGNRNPTAVMIKPAGKGPWQVLQEPYLPQKWDTMNFCCQPNGTASTVATPLAIPTGEYFVMGDNRNFSSDSRMFGLVPRKNILAKAFIRVLPFAHFGLGVGPTLVPGPAGLLLTPVTPSVVVALPLAGALSARRRRRARRSAVARSRSV